jgi:hypothetical protein
MVMAFRYWMGIGVKEDCMRALDWYESVAHKCKPPNRHHYTGS